PADNLVQLFGEEQPRQFYRLVAERSGLRQHRFQDLAITALRPKRRLLDQAPSLLEFEAQVPACIPLLDEIGAPAAKQVTPRLDRVEIVGVFRQRKAPGPAVIVEERHRRLLPPGLDTRLVLDARLQLVVAVRENVGPYVEDVTNDALHRKAAAIN